MTVSAYPLSVSVGGLITVAAVVRLLYKASKRLAQVRAKHSSACRVTIPAAQFRAVMESNAPDKAPGLESLARRRRGELITAR